MICVRRNVQIITLLYRIWSSSKFVINLKIYENFPLYPRTEWLVQRTVLNQNCSSSTRFCSSLMELGRVFRAVICGHDETNDTFRSRPENMCSFCCSNTKRKIQPQVMVISLYFLTCFIFIGLDYRRRHLQGLNSRFSFSPPSKTHFRCSIIQTDLRWILAPPALSFWISCCRTVSARD